MPWKRKSMSTGVSRHRRRPRAPLFGSDFVGHRRRAKPLPRSLVPQLVNRLRSRGRIVTLNSLSAKQLRIRLGAKNEQLVPVLAGLVGQSSRVSEELAEPSGSKSSTPISFASRAPWSRVLLSDGRTVLAPSRLGQVVWVRTASHRPLIHAGSCPTPPSTTCTPRGSASSAISRRTSSERACCTEPARRRCGRCQAKAAARSENSPPGADKSRVALWAERG